MKRKQIIIITIVCAIVFNFAIIGALAIFLFDDSPDYSIYKQNWGITIPEQANCDYLYYKDSGSDPHGDGTRYHVYLYKNEKYIEEMVDWSQSEQNNILYPPDYTLIADELLDGIDVPEAMRPNYSDCIYWHKSKSDYSKIIIFWDKENTLLYIVESFL